MDQKQLELPEAGNKEKKPRRFGRRHLIISCAALLILAAVILNIVLFGGNVEPTDPSTDTSTDNGGDNSAVDNSTEDGYFSATQVSRQRARDEALEVLQSVVDNENADEATKTEALLEIAELAAAMEAEANIETLVIAKGFTQCVAVINGDACSIVVNGESLQPNQISQINEIVHEQAGISPANIRIITK